MSKKLCLQWNDFKENTTSVIGSLREDKDFADVTLACEDGQHIVAHKVILVASSPLFKKILIGNKHSQPLIYLRGWKSVDISAIIDFLYNGEANVYQENLDSFLSIAEELQLKGLEGKGNDNESEQNSNWRRKTTNFGVFPRSKTSSRIQNSCTSQSLHKWRARGKQQININDDQNFKEKPMR